MVESCQTKVSKFDFSFVVEQYIRAFDVSATVMVLRINQAVIKNEQNLTSGESCKMAS